jgi:hypothetical protein
MFYLRRTSATVIRASTRVIRFENTFFQIVIIFAILFRRGFCQTPGIMLSQNIKYQHDMDLPFCLFTNLT